MEERGRWGEWHLLELLVIHLMGAVDINRLLRILTHPAFALGARAQGARAGHRAGHGRDGHAHGAHETRYDAWPFREQPLGEGVECEVGERPG